MIRFFFPSLAKFDDYCRKDTLNNFYVNELLKRSNAYMAWWNLILQLKTNAIFCVR